jgi:hypothetical protein
MRVQEAGFFKVLSKYTSENNIFFFGKKNYIFFAPLSRLVDSKAVFRLCFLPPTLVQRLSVLSSSVD